MKAFAFQATFFEALARPAGARVIPSELFDQFLIAVHDTVATLNADLAIESPSGVYSLAQKLKSLLLRRMFASCSERGSLLQYRLGMARG
jgi:hypothetical protein